MAHQNNMPIHVAAANGLKSEVIRLCMDSEVINAANSLGWTPLMYGAYYGHVDVVKTLLVLGADISVRNKFGGCIFTLAAVSGNLEVIRTLYYHHRIPPEKLVTTLATAVLFGHLSLVRFLIDNGADPNSPMEHSGVVPLMLAVIENHLEIVKFMVLRGANIFSQNCAGYSALQLAVIIGNKTIISFFNEKLGNSIESLPAYVTCKNKDAVVQAAKSGDLFSLKSLLSRNPSLSTSQHWMQNYDGENALNFEEDDVFKDLEDEKYNIKQTNNIFCHHTFPSFGNRNNKVGRSDLFGLCYSSYTSSFHYDSYANSEQELNSQKCALVKGVNFSKKYISGNEYLSVTSPTRSESPQKLMNHLKKNTQSSLPSSASEPELAEINKREEKGMVSSPLILASFNGHVEAARLLIAAGADPNRQRKGRTPLMVAAITSNMALVKLLLFAGADPLVESHIDSLTAFELASLSGADTELLRLLASYSMPSLIDNSYHPKSFLNIGEPLLDCWISPHRIQSKLQPFVSPKIQKNIYCWDSQCFSESRKSEKWKASPLQKLKKSWKTKARRLFSTPVRCISSESELKVNSFQHWERSLSKSQKGISDICFNYSLAQMPFDTPFESLASDEISAVKPPAFLQSNYVNIIEEIKIEKNKQTLKPAPSNQNEETVNSKHSASLPPALSSHSTIEVPLLRLEAHNSPKKGSDSDSYVNNLIPSKRNANAADIGGGFEGYIGKCELKEYMSLFMDNEVTDIEIILSITEDDLQEMGVICPVERQRILNKIHNHKSFLL